MASELIGNGKGGMVRWGGGGGEGREGWVEEEAWVWWGISTMRIFPLFFTTHCLQLLITSLPLSPNTSQPDRGTFSEFASSSLSFGRKALSAGEVPIRIPGRRKPVWFSAWCPRQEQFLCFSTPIVCSHSPHLSLSLSSHTARLFTEKKGVVGRCSQNEVTCL